MTKEYSVFRGDMYSVGVILYAVTYGMFPYGDGIASGKVKGKSYEDIAAMLRKETLTFSRDRTIPMGLVDLLEGLLQKNPEFRWVGAPLWVLLGLILIVILSVVLRL